MTTTTTGVPFLDVFLDSEHLDAYVRSAIWRAARPSQQKRYARILVATIQLARAGGYDAIQMREVSERSGIAMGTLYTYFQSRDNLAHKAAGAWNAALWEHVKDGVANARPGDSRGASVIGLVSHYLDLLRAEPLMLETWVRATLSRDPDVVAAERSLGSSYWSQLLPATDPHEADRIGSRMRILADVFYGQAVRNAFHQSDIDQLLTNVTSAARLLFADGAGVAPVAEMVPSPPARDD